MDTCRKLRISFSRPYETQSATDYHRFDFARTVRIFPKHYDGDPLWALRALSVAGRFGNR